MNTLKDIGIFVVGAVAVYAFVFMAWALMTAACVQNANISGHSVAQCGNNSFTQFVRVAYAPFINYDNKE
jgi:hypothetical protein